MALTTVGSLLDWLLLSKPSTRIEVVSAACAPPDDVVTAIIALHARKQIARTRGVDGTWWKRGTAAPQRSLLNQHLVGFRSRNFVRATHWEMLSWIDDIVLDAARTWAPRAPRLSSAASDAELADAGIAGEAFLRSRLWRPADHRETTLFWRHVGEWSPALRWVAASAVTGPPVTF